MHHVTRDIAIIFSYSFWLLHASVTRIHVVLHSLQTKPGVNTTRLFHTADLKERNDSLQNTVIFINIIGHTKIVDDNRSLREILNQFFRKSS